MFANLSERDVAAIIFLLGIIAVFAAIWYGMGFAWFLFFFGAFCVVVGFGNMK